MFHVEHYRFGIYIHVPFCMSKCGYCDFCRVTDLSLVSGYLDALRKEIKKSSVYGGRPATVYIGGGTPSCIGHENIGKLLSFINNAFVLSEVEEYTVECNPDDVSLELSRMLADCGVNRVSMGAQSLDDSILQMMGRRHNAAQVGEAIENLHSSGIDNISVDCIFGLPKIEGYDVKSDFDKFVRLDVSHLSAYALSYEDGSRFMKMVRQGALTPLDDDEVADQYALLTTVMREGGYEHYEISNYAKPGRESRHNSSYWVGTEYYGFGPGASSYVNNVRTTNTQDVREYIRSAGENKSLVEKLTDRDRYEERVMLGLRTIKGVSVHDIEEKCREEFIVKAEKEIENSNLVRQGKAYVIPEERWFVADGIIGRLI